MGSPAANQLEAVLSEKFPGIRFGRVNCRKISGSSQWSQHSWNNGRDIYPPLGVTRGTPTYFAYLDEVNAFIIANLIPLNVRVKLWRVKNHYTHIHVDFWPRGWSTPPCAGGTEIWKYPDGSTASKPTLINKYQGELMPRTLFEGMIRALFDADKEFQGDPEYWVYLIDYPDDPQWDNDFWPAFVRTIS